MCLVVNLNVLDLEFVASSSENLHSIWKFPSIVVKGNINILILIINKMLLIIVLVSLALIQMWFVNWKLQIC